MNKAILANVYDDAHNGKLVIKSASIPEISKMLNIKATTLYRALNTGCMTADRYRLKPVKDEAEYTEDDFGVKFGYQALREWKTLNKRYGRRKKK